MEAPKEKSTCDQYRHLRTVSSISDLQKACTIGALSFDIINHRENIIIGTCHYTVHFFFMVYLNSDFSPLCQ